MQRSTELLNHLLGDGRQALGVNDVWKYQVKAHFGPTKQLGVDWRRALNGRCGLHNELLRCADAEAADQL